APEQSSVRGRPRAKEQEIFSMPELIELFSLEKVQKAGAIFSIEKLNWMNGEYIRRKPIMELVPAAKEFLPDFSEADIEGALRLEQSRIQKLGDLPGRVGYLKENPEYPPELLAWKKMGTAEIRSSLERSRELLGELDGNDFSETTIEAHFLTAIGAGDKGTLLWPLRVALTGQKASPGPFEIMAVLGKERSHQRIERALGKIPA
ncbi:MAG: glutamate--tRNA ligase, partial [bacterium]|nr:glutamate--tRNA ligase [bacterium]